MSSAAVDPPAKLHRLNAALCELEAGTEVDYLLDEDEVRHVPAHVVELRGQQEVLVKWENPSDVESSDLAVDNQSRSIVPLRGLSHPPSKFSTLGEKKFTDSLEK